MEGGIGILFCRKRRKRGGEGRRGLAEGKYSVLHGGIEGGERKKRLILPQYGEKKRQKAVYNLLNSLLPASISRQSKMLFSVQKTLFY